MTTELMRDFGISAGQLGEFSAMYFYAYIAMQIPTGVLRGQLGRAKLLIGGSLVAAAGMLLFGSTSSYALASIGRADRRRLDGHWMGRDAEARDALVSAEPFADVPVSGCSWAISARSSRRCRCGCWWSSSDGGRCDRIGGVVLAVGAAAWAVVVNDPSDKGYASYAPAELRRGNALTIGGSFAGFPTLLAYRNTWLIFLAQGGFVGAMLSFTGLWGPPYLRQRFELSSTDAAAVCSVMIVCWAAASPLAGHFSDRIGRRKPIYLGGAIVAAIGWTTMFYAPLSLAGFVVVAAVTSVACGAVIVGFAYAKESVPVRFLGTITGAINVGNMIGPTILQPAIGWVLDRAGRVQSPAASRVTRSTPIMPRSR